MDQNRLKALEDQCIQECAPPCTALCPVHVDIRQVALAIGSGDFEGAYKIFRKSVPFPEIIARTCDQPCQQKCNRATVGGVIQIAALELACLRYEAGIPIRINPLPKKNARVAVIGGGLSGLTAAYDLSRKGYQVSVFEKNDQLGGQLLNFPNEQLPAGVILKETAWIPQTNVELHTGTNIFSQADLPGEYDAIYVGIGDQGTLDFGLELTPSGQIRVDPDTFQTSQPKIFAGGSRFHRYSSILSISEGRRAAVSIDRFLQNVSLTASRQNEGAYETKLVTAISSVETVAAVISHEDPPGFSKEEAMAEAKRCLQCDCMECVKVCEYLKHYGSYPKKYIREIYNNLSIVMAGRTSNKLINSCTLCGLCGEVCPTHLNMGAVNFEARQVMVETGKMPISAHDFALRDMAFSNSDRFAATLLPNSRETCTHLFFPGCQLAASNPDYIPQLYETLAGIFPDLGILLRCCGAPADWSGEADLFNSAMEVIKDQWNTLGKPKFILACSSCNAMIKKYIPEADTVSIWEIFDENRLFPAGRAIGQSYVVHDPCTTRYEPAWQNSTRTGLDIMGVSFHELRLSRERTECCGYGGVAWLAHPELVKDIVQRRIGEDNADYLTYCVMCRDFFAAQGKPTLHLLDLIYGKDLVQLANRKGPDYSQRHENRMRVKQKMIKLITGKDHVQVESHEKFNVVLSLEMRALIESRLILFEDIQKVIEHAETTQERFINQETGHTLAYFKPNLITYWVEYSQTGDAYQVHNAYSHRMEFEGEARK